MQASKEISFGKFRLDLVNECLWQGARSISLRPKAFAVLRLLVENPGLLVTKQQVLDSVWPGTFVGDAVLKDNIRQLREALNDDAASPAYIETSHRRGYRFIGKLAGSAPLKAVPSLTPVGEPVVTSAPSSPAPNWILGRDAELRKMRGWLQRALAGERQIVFVTGEPGIGKTTLVQAVLEEAAKIPGILVARGQCLEHYGAGEAYLPVLDGFSRLCRSREGAQVLTLLRQQAPAWLAQMPSLVPLSEREALQSQVAGSTRERMLRDMTEAIELLTSQSPLLLVLEDLHWSDHSTLDLISYLARRRDSARLMVIGTYRPVDVILSEHPLKAVKRELQAHGLCRELPLEYLAEEAVAEYLSTRFPGHRLPARLRRVVYQRTEGNPLFMVNLMEYLIDQNMIVEDKSGGWNLQVDLSDVEKGVPANLRQLIEKQIERLDPDERLVLEAASIAGMECSSVAIAAGLDNTLEWVEEHCEALVRRHHFLTPARLVELPDGSITPRHRFVHVLYRDVPYRIMAPMRRAQVHQRIADRGVAIYGSHSNEIAAELAMHFEESRDWPRALQYLAQAAENATRKSAHHEAADLAQRGLQVLKLLPQSAERDRYEATLRMILILSLMAVKGFAWAGVEKVYAEGGDLFRSGEPSPELFNWLYLLGLLNMFRGKIRPALGIANQVVELAQGLRDTRLIMEAHRAKGSTLLEMGRCSEALEQVDRASHLYSVSANHKTLISGRDCKVLSECSAGKALWALGLPDAALRRMQVGLEHARALAHPQSLAYATHFAAQLHQYRGEPLLARQCGKEGLQVAEEYYLELWATFCKIDLGWAEAELGDVDQGIERMKEGLVAYEATETRIFFPAFLGSLADQLNKAHRIEEGLDVIARAIACAEQTEEGYAMAELHRIRGELLVSRCDLLQAGKPRRNSARIPALSEARASFDAALAIAKQQGAKAWELRAALSQYRLDLLLGNADSAHLAKTHSAFTEGFETADMKQASAYLNHSVLTTTTT